MRNNRKKYWFYSIKIQMSLAIFLMIVILTVGLMATVNVILSKEYDDEINSNNEIVTHLLSSNLQGFLEKAYNSTEDLAHNAQIQGMDSKEQEVVLKDYAQRNEYVELLFIQGTDGMQTARSTGECADRSDRWWFPMVTEEGKSFISKSYLSATGNMAVSTVFIPIRKNENVVGSIGMDIRLDYIQQLIEDNSDADSGRYSFVMDGEGVILAHPESEYVQEMYNYKTETKQVDGREEPLEGIADFKTITEKVMSGESASCYFKNGADGYYCAYTPVSVPGESDTWSIVTVQDEETAKSIISDITKTSSAAAAGMLIVSVVIGYLLTSSIANPIKKVSSLLSRSASGDFTVSINVRSKNEIGILAESFNEMISKVSELLRNTKQLSGHINESIILLDEKSAGATQKAESIKSSANEIQAGTAEQAEDAEKSASMSNEMKDYFEDLSGQTKKMVEDARIAAQSTSEGSNTVTELKEKNKLTYDSIVKTAAVVEKLNQQSEIIGGILNSLDDISSQTNLLSLNASIEAARAGEHGKGFVVVAEEIQKLSIQSAEATKNISNIIMEIQTEIHSSVELMEEMKTVSKEQGFTVENVLTAFDKIQRTTGDIIKMVQGNGKLVADMQENNAEIVSSISNMAAISQETAASTETVVAAISGQSEEIIDIAAQAAQLKERMELLDREVKKFQI